ncbi:MAG: TOBE domain-containing protein, partial [Candidatus Moranbacteria bacterium]|nr:TOBE domain-containing protein [Candidatus Moranbacteria bacterium]
FHSATPAVARFLGPVNEIPPALFERFQVDESISGPLNGRPLAARPENLVITADPDGAGRITDKTFAGHYTVYQVAVPGHTCTIWRQPLVCQYPYNTLIIQEINRTSPFLLFFYFAIINNN